MPGSVGGGWTRLPAWRSPASPSRRDGRPGAAGSSAARPEGSAEHRMYKGFPILDGDRHYTEPTALWAEYVEPRYREVAVTQYRDGNGYTWTRFDRATTERELAE